VEAPFQFERFGASLEVCCPNQLQRSSFGGIFAALATAVLGHAIIEVVSVPSVIGAVGATEDVNIKRHGERVAQR
jgi:hypothetical protein